MTNSQFKDRAIMALKSEFGFAPKKSEIVLQETQSNGTYILFRVANKTYKFQSSVGFGGSVWCGSGTISRVTE